MKISKELIKAVNRYADYYEKEEAKKNLKNSFADTKDELMAMNIRINNGEEKRSDLEDRIMEITQSKQQAESKKKNKKKAIIRDIWNNIGFPDSSVGKESVCNAGNRSLIPGSRRSPGEGIGYPLQYFGLPLWLSW